MDFLGVDDAADWGDWTESKDLHTQLFSPGQAAGKKSKASKKSQIRGEVGRSPDRGSAKGPLDERTDGQHRPSDVAVAHPKQDGKETPKKKEKKLKRKVKRGVSTSSDDTALVTKKPKGLAPTGASAGRQAAVSTESQEAGVESESLGTRERMNPRKKRKRKPRNNKFKTAEFGCPVPESKPAPEKLDPGGVSARTQDDALPGEAQQDGHPSDQTAKKKKKRKRKPRNNKFKDSKTAAVSSKSQSGEPMLEDRALPPNQGKQGVMEKGNAKLRKAAEGRKETAGTLKRTRTDSRDGEHPRKRKKAGESQQAKSSTEPSESGIGASGRTGGQEKMAKKKDSPRLSEGPSSPTNALAAQGPVNGGGKEGGDASDSEEPLADPAARQALRNQMEARLTGAHFRFLNEQLYRSADSQARQLMASDREAFQVYHQGFGQQVSRWPANPVDHFIRDLKSRPASLVVGDFGCGEARIATSASQKVHSFDLCALNEHVTQCDLEKVPLKKNCLDVAIFCLSLMGKDWIAYIKEANRVLKKGGQLLIAEVASRFASVPEFLKILKLLGFKKVGKDFSNKMFLRFDFVKEGAAREVEMERGKVLRPCLYKRR